MTKLDQSPRHRPNNNYRGSSRRNASNSVAPKAAFTGAKRTSAPRTTTTGGAPVMERRAPTRPNTENTDPMLVFKEFQKIVNSAKENFSTEKKTVINRVETTDDEELEQLEARIRASNLLNDEIKRCTFGMFPGTIEADQSIIDYDDVSLNESLESPKSTVRTSDSLEEEKEVFENPALGTMETIQDAERRLNVNIASWFKKHLDQGNAFDNIMNDYFKLKEQRKGLYSVPYLSYELDTTHKETYKVRANRINPEDYRGMRFIICDHPNKDTLEDFWRLVWKERARAVVSLQFDALESGMSFPADYWPNRANAMLQFGDFIVKYRGCRYKTAFMHTTNPASDKHVYRTTSLSIYNTKKLRVRANNIENEIDRMLVPHEENTSPEDDYLDCFECHTIKHICFERWPDLLIPIPWSFVNSHSDMGLLLSEQVLKQELRNHQRFRGPVVVHTPVGNSRAITFIALKHSLARLFFDRVVDVPASVLNVFKQRNHGSVSSCQFMLLNLLVMEEALRRCMVETHYRQKVDRLWDELIYYVGRKYGYALSTFYRGVRMITE